jgi:hypothetical protein
MGPMVDFQKIEALFRDIITSMTDIEGYFTSDECHSQRHLAVTVTDTRADTCETITAVTRSEVRGSEIGMPGLEEDLSFAAHHLGVNATQGLPEGQKKIADGLLHDTFMLELTCHLCFHTFPTRGEVNRVTSGRFLLTWSAKATEASKIMKPFSGLLGKLPRRVFRCYFSPQIEQPLREVFTVEGKGLRRCRNYFENLIFAGAPLGTGWNLLTHS